MEEVTTAAGEKVRLEVVNMTMEEVKDDDWKEAVKVVNIFGFGSIESLDIEAVDCPTKETIQTMMDPSSHPPPTLRSSRLARQRWRRQSESSGGALHLVHQACGQNI